MQGLLPYYPCTLIHTCNAHRWCSDKEYASSVGDAGDMGSIPGSGRYPGEGNSNLLQYFCLENPRDRGSWQAAVQGVAESDMT